VSRPTVRLLRAAATSLLVVALSSGCVRTFLVNSAADALASGGTGGGAFASDDDPELVAEALPFGLKTMEVLLQETPEHRNLLVGLASGFTQYAQGFVLPRARDASMAERERIEARARKLHLRAHRYGLRALEVDHPGFLHAFKQNPEQAVNVLTADDVDALYWTGAPLGAAISISATDMDLLAQVPAMEALMERALQLDPDWGGGALHEFFIQYEGRSEAMGGSVDRAKQHFERAVQLQGGKKAGPYLAYAMAVAVKKQDRALFDELIDKALAIDPEAAPDYRLINTIDQERARWLREHAEDFIL
jgi:predicted anti-sigma-YlaC factor YlaD